MTQRALSGWGRFPVHHTCLVAPRTIQDLSERVQAGPSVIARGSGRAYGDSAINAQTTLSMRHFNRMLAFDPDHGQLVAEAGVTLAEVIAVFLPRGWFPPVVPGTANVTLGGAIAADVHGKNHMLQGSFRSCVDWIEVMGPEGAVRRCSWATDRELFDRTLGGMGLTGIITRAAIRLRPVETGWLRQTTQATPDLRATLAALVDGQADYRVAWLDLPHTRALVMHADHALRAELPPELATAQPLVGRPRKLGITLPASLINRATSQAVNAAYFHAHKRRAGIRYVGWHPFFFPLDAIADWNRAYGRRGLVQFQCVLPTDQAEHGLKALIQTISAAHVPPVLSVLKCFGAQESAFSFPMQGITLAVDFPASAQALALLDQLDPIVIAHGGRLYLAKDARMTAATLRAADPRVGTFETFRAMSGTGMRFQSAQSDRLEL